MRKRFVLWIAACALLFCVSARADVSRDLDFNDRPTLQPGVQYAFTFTPTANNRYRFGFYGDGAVSATLYLEGEDQPLRTETDSFETTLIADAVYRLEARAEGAPVDLDIMRAARGRCFDQPITLTDLTIGYDKIITRAYDTHFYRFTAPVDGRYIIRSQSDMNLIGFLLDERGVRVATNDNLYPPYALDFRLQCALTAGETYTLRVSARGEGTGSYHLSIVAAEPSRALPEQLVIEPSALTLLPGAEQALTCTQYPADAIEDIVWVSADPEIASVTQTGLVTARGVGQTQIICVGAGLAEARVPVTVEPIPVTGIEVTTAHFMLNVGESIEPNVRVLPETASNRAVRITSADERVARVMRDGRLHAIGEGETQLTFTSEDGGFTAVATVSVATAPPVWRALVIGEQRYSDGRVRVGSANTTQGIADLLKRQSHDIQVTAKLDTTRAEALAAIKDTFAEAKPADISIFYINCHGYADLNNVWLEFHDGSRLTARQLERALRDVPGRVVLLIDCCQSGRFISKKAARDVTGRFVQAFSSGDGSRLLSSKYTLLVSTSAEQDSYRIGYGDEVNESAMATAFARALCEAGGWDLVADRGTRMRADVARDQRVTVDRAYRYVRERVRALLGDSGAAQDVQLWPMGASIPLFERVMG